MTSSPPSKPSLFIDECVPEAVAAALETAGYDCVFARDLCLSAPDPDVAATARRLQLPLITEDRGFGRLFLNSFDPPPTLILAMSAARASQKAARLIDLFASQPELLQGGLTIIETERVRGRSPAHPGYTRPMA